ncbi:adenylyl-sulfate kinase [Nocardioides sp. BP30]|uniref:adenylyl-sulfate kinase n=1 Tax=Nocardioides sp. BP30 TaxID=3036374 RepID=UPI0024689F6A|nr:adenylyl-sulfate kinase [Nocardioides sp. BP30]WGL53067.1 adenylyl-sulfate kinase [Nocardioides sp. BP30]
MPDAPQFSPTARELDDLELIAHGALPNGFNAPGSVVTLTLPDDVASAALEAGAVELVDPEGLPLARVAWPAGTVTPLATPAYGPFRRLYLSPAQAREQYAGRTFVPVTGPLTRAELAELAPLGPIALLALVGDGTPDLSAVALLRATLAAARQLPEAAVIAVPLAAHGDPEADHALGVHAVTAYAGADPVRALSGRFVEGAGADDDAPGEDFPDEVAAIVEADRPARDAQGLVLFFTGLSGSGKSTLARALMDRLLETGQRTVTSLDGDVVRRNLSAGLTFSKADRETNIRRIGWVAAEISRHGGVAVCSPIAPFDATRQDVRRYVEEAGGAFFLIHVATPLEECERRDRKGLYAKARAGVIPEFTGISSPYEVPQDADVRVDTTGRTIEEALDDVLVALRSAGYLDLEVGPATTAEPGDGPGDTPGEEPLKVLFVCTANICRSPFMELTARRLAGTAGLEFSSAGTHGWDDKPMDAAMVQVLGDGIEAGDFRSRAVSRDLLDRADLVLTAEAAQRSYLLQDHPDLFRKVFTLGQAAEAIGRLEPGLAPTEVVERLASARGHADPALDVPDPYRRGPEAAAAAAEHIGRLLATVLPALSRTNR